MTEATEERSDEDMLLSRETNRSLLSLLNSAREVADAVKALPVDLLEMSEKELRKLVKPSEVDELLRVSFWNEYKRAQSHGEQMRAINIYTDICTKLTFYRKVRDKEVLAFIVCPARHELTVQQEMLALSYRKMREILVMPAFEYVYSKDGKRVGKKVNVALLKLQFEVGQKIEDRLRGSVVQRQQIESKSLTVHTKGESLQQIEAELSAIKALEEKLVDPIDQAKLEAEVEWKPEPHNARKPLDGEIITVTTKDGAVL